MNIADETSLQKIPRGYSPIWLVLISVSSWVVSPVLSSSVRRVLGWLSLAEIPCLQKVAVIDERIVYEFLQ
jgi:hypothetical protein